MNARLIIVGASGHGKVVADIAEKISKWNEILFLDDNIEIKSCLGFKVIGKTNDYIKYKDEADFFVAIGDNIIRERVNKKFLQENLSIATLIHPSAILGKNVEVGLGTVIMAGVIINPDTIIGSGCIINTNANIDHDNIIGDYVHISPGVQVAGNVNIGRNCWLGIGAIISNNIVIADNCNIGAGGLVIKDIEMSGIYIGVPVRKL